MFRIIKIGNSYGSMDKFDFIEAKNKVTMEGIETIYRRNGNVEEVSHFVVFLHLLLT